MPKIPAGNFIKHFERGGNKHRGFQKFMEMKNIAFSKIWVIGILAVVLAGGFFAWQYWAPKPAPADETADWQTYKNEEYGFEIKYPQDWIINDKLPEKLKGSRAHAGENLIISNDPISEVPGFILWINPTGSTGFGLPPVDIFYKFSPNKKSGIKINKRTEIPQTSEGISNIDGKTIIGSNAITFGSNDYFFLFIFKEAGKNYESIFNQMLSTFRFLPPK